MHCLKQQQESPAAAGSNPCRSLAPMLPSSPAPSWSSRFKKGNGHSRFFKLFVSPRGSAGDCRVDQLRELQ